jgi:hypothetical protein
MTFPRPPKAQQWQVKTERCSITLAINNYGSPIITLVRK